MFYLSRELQVDWDVSDFDNVLLFAMMQNVLYLFTYLHVYLLVAREYAVSDNMKTSAC